jgi:hypothetical protein
MLCPDSIGDVLLLRRPRIEHNSRGARPQCGKLLGRSRVERAKDSSGALAQNCVRGAASVFAQMCFVTAGATTARRAIIHSLNVFLFTTLFNPRRAGGGGFTPPPPPQVFRR